MRRCVVEQEAVSSCVVYYCMFILTQHISCTSLVYRWCCTVCHVSWETELCSVTELSLSGEEERVAGDMLDHIICPGGIPYTGEL